MRAWPGFVLAGLLATGLVACGDSSSGTASVAAQASPASASPSPTPMCGGASGSGFAVSLVSNRGGQPTPVSASQWFAEHEGVWAVPTSGWREAGSDDQGVFTESGGVRLHVIQGPDKTWQVDSGEKCG
jgi:hypothetical protein